MARGGVTPEDLLAFREQVIAFNFIQTDEIKARLEELKATLADLQAYQSIEDAKANLEAEQADYQKQVDALDAKAVAIEEDYNKKLLDIKNKTEKLTLQNSSLQDREGSLASAQAKLADDVHTFEQYKTKTNTELTTRLDSVQASEAVYNDRLIALVARETKVAKQLELLKSI